MRIRTERAEYFPPQHALTGGTTAPVQDTTVKRGFNRASAKCVGGSTGYLELKPPIRNAEYQYFRVAFRADAKPAVNEGVFRLEDATGTLLEIIYRTSGKFNAFTPITTAGNIGGESTETTLGNWYILEIKIKVEAAGESSPIAWRILNDDGSTFYAEQTGTHNFRNAGVKQVRAGHLSTQAPNYNVCDLAMNDSRGSVNNSWIGAAIAATPEPSSEGCYQGAIMDGDVNILEADLGNWGAYGGSLTTDMTDFKYGKYSVLWTPGAIHQGVLIGGPAAGRLTPTAGSQNTGSVYFKGKAGDTFKLILREYAAGEGEAGFIGQTEATAVATGGWDRISATRTFGASGVRADMLLWEETSATLFRADAAQLEVGASAGAYGGEVAHADAPFGGTGVETWNRYEEHQGRAVGLVGFSDPWTEGELKWDGFGTGASDSCRARNAIPFKTLGGPTSVVSRVNAGTEDAKLKAYADAAKAWGHPFFLRLWWECNFTGIWAWNTATPEEYVTAWQRVYGIFQERGATNATFVWAPNILYGAEDPEPWYPGDAYVHWTGFDAYNGEHPQKLQGWRTVPSLLTPTYKRLLEIAPSKPMFIGEIGCSEYTTPTIHNTGEKAKWLTELFPTLKTLPAIKAISWFNWNIEHSAVRVDWPIESAAEGKPANATREAYAAAIKDPYFFAPNATTMTDLKVVPVPTLPVVPPPVPPPVSTLLIPKLRVPLEMGNQGLRTVEQDSPDEVQACVYALLATERGSRIEDLDYGVSDPAFTTIPIAEDEWMAQIEGYEPRARVEITQEADGVELSDRINVGVE